MSKQRFLSPGLVLAGVLAAIFPLGASTAQQLPGQIGGSGPSASCRIILVPLTDPGGCVGTTTVCTDALGNVGDSCCSHFHMPLTWNEARQWVHPTGSVRGPSFKKFYSSHDDVCVGTMCVTGPVLLDLQHFKREATLVSCPPR